MTKLIVDYRETTNHGDIIQIRIWRVPESEDFPEGSEILPRLHSRVEGDSYTRVLGYDNERGEEYHRHYFSREEPIEFERVED